MVSIATKIMWLVNCNNINQHTKFGYIQTKIDKIIIKSCIFQNTLKLPLTDLCILGHLQPLVQLATTASATRLKSGSVTIRWRPSYFNICIWMCLLQFIFRDRQPANKWGCLLSTHSRFNDKFGVTNFPWYITFLKINLLICLKDNTLGPIGNMQCHHSCHWDYG